MPEPDPVQGPQCQPAPRAAAHPGVQQPVGHVAKHALGLGQEELLEHEPDPGRPQRGQFPVGHPRHVQAGDAHAPGGRRVQGAHQVQQRGLARPRRAHDGGQLPFGHRQAHPGQRPHRRVPGIHLRYLLQLQHRHPAWPVPAGQGRPRGGHDVPTTTRCPGVSAPLTCTMSELSSKIGPTVTGTRCARVVPAPTTSTAYPPEAWATRALTGTASTSRAVAVMMFTVTGAWSRAPAAPGSVSVTVTAIVVLGLCPDDAGAVVATAPTDVTTPGVVVPSGSVTVTASPALTSDSWETSSGIITTCRSEVACSTGPFAGPPRLPVTWLTRSAVGSNTTCPSHS